MEERYKHSDMEENGSTEMSEIHRKREIRYAPGSLHRERERERKRNFSALLNYAN
jgi:hypothetical protein